MTSGDTRSIRAGEPAPKPAGKQAGAASPASIVGGADRLAALRRLKNTIIGHEQEKLALLRQGLGRELLSILSLPSSSAAEREQAAICLSALASGEPRLAKFMGDCTMALVFDTVIACVTQIDVSPRLAAPLLRLLVSLYRAAPTAERASFFTPEMLSTANTLVTMAGSSGSTAGGPVAALQFGTYACQLVDVCCDTPERQAALEQTPLLESIFYAIALCHLDPALYQPWQKVRNCHVVAFVHAGLAALNQMAQFRPEQCERLCTLEARVRVPPPASGRVKMVNFLSVAFQLLHSSSQGVRLTAVALITAVHQSDLLSESATEDLRLHGLPCLISLLEQRELDVGVVSEVLRLMAYIITNNEDMQQAVGDAGVVAMIARYLQDTFVEQGTGIKPGERRVEVTRQQFDDLASAGLLCLASITLSKDFCRKKVCESHLVPFILHAMQSRSAQVRVAACQCVRSLSRSIFLLRTELADSGLGEMLFRLLSDPDLAVKTVACAALCNFVLDFGSTRKAIVDPAILDVLCDLTQQQEAALRQNALWALKHVVFSADRATKELVLQRLGVTNLVQLCNDPDLGVEEQALDVLRNVLCGRKESIDTTLRLVGADELYSILNDKLTSECAEIVIPAVYIVVHIAGGSDLHRNSLLQRTDLMLKVCANFTHSNPEVRLGCVWVAINLTWSDEDVSASGGDTAGSTSECARQLRQLGFVAKLHELSSDPSIDIRERVKTALSQLEGLGGAEVSATEGEIGEIGEQL